jgi:hypothetical protein
MPVYLGDFGDKPLETIARNPGRTVETLDVHSLPFVLGHTFLLEHKQRAHWLLFQVTDGPQ